VLLQERALVFLLAQESESVFPLAQLRHRHHRKP
jgi:hypothetical protein